MSGCDAENSRIGGPAPTLGSSIEQRLGKKSLDVGAATPVDIFKIFSVVHDLTVEFLARRDFCRIATPSLIGYMYPGEEDDHFAVPYFDQGAWLAPTGEVNLGIALASELERVYDIHNVFRREEVVDGRHLTEVSAFPRHRKC
jgi:aspartyl-tRNA synthetase